MANQSSAVNTAAKTKLASKYATGYWLHLFGSGPAETRCRIVIDLEQSKLVAAQEWAGLKFEDVLGDRLKDLAESVIEVNEAHTNPNDWAFVATDVLPAWATTQETPAAPPQGTITLQVTLQELKVIQAAVREYRELINSPTSADRDALGYEWADREVDACDAFLKRTIELHRAPSTMWTLETAGAYVEDLAPIFAAMKVEALIVGSVATRGKSEKDLDIVLKPLPGVIMTTECGLEAIFEHLLPKMAVDVKPEPLATDAPEPAWFVNVGTEDGRTVEFYLPESAFPNVHPEELGLTKI